MAEKKNRIDFYLDFKKGDMNALKDLKKDIADIQMMAGDADFISGLKPKEIQKMTDAARTLNTALDQAFDVNLNTVNIQKFNNYLKQSGYTVATLQKDLSYAGVTGQQAFLKMTGQLMQFNTVTKQVNKFLDGLATSFFNTVKWGIMSSIMNNISGTIQKAYYYVEDLDSALNDIRIVTGKSADEMKRFSKQANEAARALAVTTENYTQGSLIYYQQGLDDETVKTLTDITAKTSNVTGQTMSVVSEQLTAVWNGYKVANEAAEKGMQVYEEYVDKMAAVGATTASDLQELSTAMSKVASAASSMGVTFDDLNAQIATIVSVTRQAPESVGTALKTIYARLGDLKVDGVDEFGVKLGEVTTQLQTMGINILDQNGNMREMSSVMAEVAEKWDTWTSAQRQAAAVAMAGKRQYNNLVALFDNWDMYGKALETSLNAAGILEKQQETAMESLANKMNVLKATAEKLYGVLFDTDTIGNFIEKGIEILDIVSNLTEALGGLNNILPMIGSIGLTVFSEQIGRDLSTIIINAQNAQNNLKNMEASFQTLSSMYKDSALFNSANGSATQQIQADQLKELKVYYEEMYQYASIMTQEQKEQYNNILKQKVEMGSLAIEVQDMIDNWKNNDPYGIINKEIIQNITDTKVWSAESKRLNSIITGLGAVFDENEITIEKITNQLNGVSDLGIKRVTATFERLVKSGMDESKALEIIIKNIEKVKNSAQSIVYLDDKVKNATASTKQLGDALKNNLNTTKMVIDITKTVGALGQLVSVVSMIQNIGNIADNESLSQTEKFTQLLANLSFTLPMAVTSSINLAKGITSLGSVFKNIIPSLFSLNTLQEARIAYNNAERVSTLQNILLEQASQKISKEKILKLIEENGLIELHITAVNKDTKEQVKNALASKGIIGLSPEVIAAITGECYATEMNTIAKSAGTKANLAFAASAGIIAVAVVAAAGAIFYAYYKEQQAREAAIKARQEEQKAFEEAHEAKRKEIKETQDLIQSYIDLYAKYKDGNAEKSVMVEKTNKLVDILGEERIAVANLTGDYESLNKEMREHQKNQIQKKINQNNQEITEAINNLNNVEYVKDFSSSNIEATQKVLEQNNLTNYFELSDTGNLRLKAENVKAENVGEVYGALSRLIKAFPHLRNELIMFAGQVEDQLGRIRTNYIENESLEVEKNAAGKNLDSVNSFEEYNKILQETIADLRKTGDYQKASQHDVTEAAINMLSGLSGNNKTYEQRARGTNYLVNKYGENYGKIGNITNFANNLTDDELALVLQDKVYIDSKTTEEEIHNQLDIIQKEASKDDLSIAVSLRAKLTSDKKLTKSELEEYAQEQGLLLQDYEVELHDFENQSNLEQVQNLNAIVDDKIAANQRYLQEVKQDAQDEVELYEKNLEEFKKLQYQKNAANYDPNVKKLSEEEQKRYEELKKILEDTSDTYEHYKELLDEGNGLLLDEFDNTIFDNLVSGLEGVVSEAEILRDIAEDVGENWIIAAEDIEHFGKNFPDVLAAQKNYNVLEDGSIQLKKEGQQVLQDTVNIYKKELIAKNESYQLELQKQADIQKAQADYYKSMADNLRSYLSGEKTAGEVEASMAQDLSDFKAALIEAEAGDNEELARVMQEDLDNVTSNARNNTSNIYEYWSSVGTVAALAGRAYDDGFEDPGLNPKGQAGPSGVKEGSGYSSKRRNDGSDPLDGLWKMSDEEIQSLIDEYDKRYTEAYNRYSSYISEKTNLGTSVNEAIYAMDNAAAGKGGKGSKSSSKDKKDKEKKELEDEFNKYFDIEKAIEAVDRQVSLLEEHQKNLHGKELIDSLKQENELIEKQTENYKKLYAAQQEEAKELGAILKGKGLEFTDDGAISNYAEATTAALAKYNAAVDAYNAGTMDDAAFEIQEKAYERFKKQLERYEELYYKEMQDTFDKIDENNRKVLDNNLKAWETEIQIQLDLNEAEREWNKFFKEIGTDFKKVFKDLQVEIKAIAAEAKTYQSDIAVDIKAINDTMAEIDKLNADQATDHTQAISQAQEKLKELNDQLMDHASSLHQAVEDAWDAYLEGIDQAAEKFDKLNDQFDRINNQLEFQGELIELMYGEKAYDLMDKLYEGQEHASRNQIQSVQQQLDFWKKLYNETSEGDEDHEKALKKMNELQDELNDLTLDYIKTLKNEYGNTINKILDDLNKKLTGGKGSDWLTEEWERASNFSDIYFDGFKKAYHIQTLANKVEKDISNTYKENVKAQQKLAKYRDIEITKLKDIKNLRQEDLDIAEAKHDLILKEIALEESRNNKNAMKLVRNEQGNLSYQYVADEEEEDNRQQDKLDSNYNLYETANNAYNAVINEQLKAATDYTNQIKDLQMNEAIKEEEKNARMAALRDSFIEESKIRQEKANDYFNELKVAGTALGIELYNQDETAFAGMLDNELQYLNTFITTEKTDYLSLEEAFRTNYADMDMISRSLMENTRVDWSQSAEMLEALWNGDEDSVRVAVENAYSAMQDATQEYKNKITELEKLVHMKFYGKEGEENIVNSIKMAENETDILKEKTKELVNESNSKLEELKGKLKETENSWYGVADSIQTTINKLATYLRMQGKEYTGGAASVNVPDAKIDRDETTSSKSTTKDDGGSNNGGLRTDPEKDYKNYTVQSDPQGVYGTKGLFFRDELKVIGDGDDIEEYLRNIGISDNDIEALRNKMENSKNKGYIGFKTGGYTGEWNGDNGKLAVLHKKEMVLNADDTANLLNTVSIMRNLQNKALDTAYQMAAIRTQMSASSYSGGTRPVQTDTGSTFYIDRLEFPNANSVDEIRMAIMSLPNVASQYVNRNVK